MKMLSDMKMILECKELVNWFRNLKIKKFKNRLIEKSRLLRWERWRRYGARKPKQLLEMSINMSNQLSNLNRIQMNQVMTNSKRERNYWKYSWLNWKPKRKRRKLRKKPKAKEKNKKQTQVSERWERLSNCWNQAITTLNKICNFQMKKK